MFLSHHPSFHILTNSFVLRVSFNPCILSLPVLPAFPAVDCTYLLSTCPFDKFNISQLSLIFRTDNILHFPAAIIILYMRLVLPTCSLSSCDPSSSSMLPCCGPYTVRSLFHATKALFYSTLPLLLFLPNYFHFFLVNPFFHAAVLFQISDISLPCTTSLFFLT